MIKQKSEQSQAEARRFHAIWKICHQSRYGEIDGVMLDLRHADLPAGEWYAPTLRHRQQDINKPKVLGEPFIWFPWLTGLVNPVTGRLHANFLIAGASTSRFSANRPNLQQMPKAKLKGFRKIFPAPPGQLIMALDYSQIELRVAAELISDWFSENQCDVYRNVSVKNYAWTMLHGLG